MDKVTTATKPGYDCKTITATETTYSAAVAAAPDDICNAAGCHSSTSTEIKYGASSD